MLKQNLQQKLGLKINPLQIQLIKLLELPTINLNRGLRRSWSQTRFWKRGRRNQSRR